ncbi:MAG: trimeric intracellular cation channel family protein [Actinomycetaceae bacterium]|nr:trimeric intracellular cation channel family protein [Actinomycetaceae bacterium]
MLHELNQFLPDLFRGLDLMGVLLNGILGGQLARDRKFDAVGFAVLAIMSALGGGMLRDTLLQAGPPVALTDPYYLSTALAGAFIAFCLRFSHRYAQRLLAFADGVVLGCWAATGVLKTLNLGYGVIPALMMGVITAVGGGMIRDVSAGIIPRIFGGNTLYAIPAALAALVTVLFYNIGQPMLGMLAATVTGAMFVALAGWRKWRLPVSGEWTVTMTPRQLRSILRRRGLNEDGLAGEHRVRTSRSTKTRPTGAPKHEQRD